MTSITLLEELFGDQEITDVLFDGHLSALSERRGEFSKISELFHDQNEVDLWARNVINQNGGRLDISKPIAEVSLDTSVGLLRVHVVLAGECSKRTQVSIRRHARTLVSLDDLLHTSALDQGQLQLLRKIIHDKENFVIVGGTGSGKTTLLRAMLGEVSSERIITIEESPELSLYGNTVALTTRESNHEGVGEIGLGHLLKESLRMRPDRLVIGEARGAELLILLQALNTGHSGSGFTMHANSSEDAVPRMLAILASAGLAPQLSKVLIASSISWVVEVKRISAQRVVTRIERLEKQIA
jgi:pilus assembly protein CpaF